jgi:hypothetical protein
MRLAAIEKENSSGVQRHLERLNLSPSAGDRNELIPNAKLMQQQLVNVQSSWAK